MATGTDAGEMTITRINDFQAHVDGGPALRAFLRSIIPLVRGAQGCRSVELLARHDDPTRFAIIEVWDSIESHQAAASRVPPALMQQARTLFAAPPQGAYYQPVSNDGS